MNTLGTKLLTIAGVTAVTGGILSIVGGKSPDTAPQVDKQGSSGQEQIIQQAERPSEKRLPNRSLESSATSEGANTTTASAVVSTNSVKAGEVAKSEARPIISAKPVASVKPTVSGISSTPNKIDIAAKNHTDSQIAAAARTGKASAAAPQAQQQVMALSTMQVQMPRQTIEMPTMPVMPTPPQLPVPERFLQMPQYFVQQPAVSSK